MIDMEEGDTLLPTFENISLSEIVARHQVRKQLATDRDDLLSQQSSTLAGYFTIKASNAYTSSEGNSTDDDDQMRTVQIKIIDVLYNNKLCNLVYMRDTTSLFKREPVVDNAKNKFFDCYIQNPRRFQFDLKKYLQNTADAELSEQT